VREKPLSYAEAGVDIAQHKKTHAVIGKLIESTFQLRRDKVGRVLTPFGHYASLIELDDKRALALHVDGVGSKVLVAQAMEKYDTVGIDCVAMCVNDLICVGAEPISLIDYLALQEPNQKLVEEVMMGLVRGAEIAEIAIVGGETAILPEIISGISKGKGFDLSAMVVGTVDKDKAITGKAMKPGDAVIGLESSGVHSNGLTLARKVFFGKSKCEVQDVVHGLKRTVGEELLEPTKIYVNEVLEVIKCHDIHALAHITGGAFSKLSRFKDYSKVGFELDDMPRPQPVFQAIQTLGNISDEEMYKTFNMGIGFCIVCPDGEVDSVLKTLRKKFKAKAQQIGTTAKEYGIRVNVPSGKEWVTLA
jgi:phosphoribosylformylglycinamidine cyclo-ligase